MSRIAKRFAELKEKNKTGLVTFITAGDPDREQSQEILNALPANGADLIELGMPFSDPMADGPAIQASSQRALAANSSMVQTLEMVKSFRVNDTETPLILMGYYNPIYTYGTARFAREAKESGVDGLIIVDLPPEEDQEFHDPANDVGLDLIRLVTPTTDDKRLQTILSGASGFLYYVAIAGVTGTASADVNQLKPRLDHLREKTDLPIAIGFGIKTPDDAAAMAQIGDAIVVGSSIVEVIAQMQDGSANVQDVSNKIKSISAAL